MDNINLQRIEGYTVQLVAEDVWAIDEFGADIIYLVKGEKSAAVIDTGSGFGNLKKVIETLTDLPYVVLNTHGHLDHVGGNHEFGKAYLSEKDFKMADTEKLRSGWKKYVEKTKKEPGFYGTEYIIEGREPGDFQMLPLSEHQIFDLGGRSLEVLFTPGHTPGSVVFLDRKNKFLFAGDSVVSTPILIFDTYSSTVKEYAEGLKKLDKEDFELIFPGHFIRPIGKAILHDLITCADKIVEGTATPELIDFSHMSSEPAVLYKYGKGNIAYNDKHIC